MAGNVFGTHWHGAFESDEFRRAVPHRGGPAGRPARLPGRRRTPASPRPAERTLDLLGDLVEEHLDTDALWRLIESGPPRRAARAPARWRGRFDDPRRDAGLAAAGARRRRPRLGAGPLVAVDGPSGAGKTHFAGRLAGLARRARRHARPDVVHTDDLLDGWDDQVTFWPRLERVGARARCAAGGRGGTGGYDWHAGRFA